MKKERKKIILNRTSDGKHVNIFLIFSVTLIMVVLIIGSWISPDRDMSENENRYLTQLPEFSISDILDGRFESQLENYLSDQIIGRENWIKIMSTTLEGIGYKDVKGVYLMDDGRLAERVTPVDFKFDRYSNNLDEIVKLNMELHADDEDLANTPNVRVMLVPSAAYSYREESNTSTNFNEAEAFEIARVKLGDMFINLENELMPSVSSSAISGEDRESPEFSTDNYYKTDHHWNYYGAYKAYETYKDSVGLDQRDFTPKELTSDFKGTLYSKVLINDRVRDKIEVPSGSLKSKVTVKINGENYDSIYFMDKLEQKDKYEVFFGGNYDRVDIISDDYLKNKSSDDSGSSSDKLPGTYGGKEKLLIVKDSYANSFVPFILDDFDVITMIDTRYFRDSVKDLILDEGYDEVLVLYSINNFAAEKLNLTEKALM